LYQENVIHKFEIAILYYAMVAMTLNAFAVSVPGDKEPLA
jgi:hypothetical protein